MHLSAVWLVHNERAAASYVFLLAADCVVCKSYLNAVHLGQVVRPAVSTYYPGSLRIVRPDSTLRPYSEIIRTKYLQYIPSWLKYDILGFERTEKIPIESPLKIWLVWF